MPNVLAIVCNFNKRGHLRDLLASLRKLGGPAFDVLVVDNASTDGSAQMVREEFPEFALHETGANLGGTGGFNAGMAWGLRAAAPYDFFWLLDNDIIVHEGALAALLDTAATDPKIALVGSTILHLNDETRVQEMGATVDWETGDLLRAGEGPLADIVRPRLFEVDYAAACSLLARVEAIREVGTWDPAYFVYWDDIDWGIRMNRAGWLTLSTTESLVRHESFDNRRPTSGSAMNYLRFRNGYYFFWRFCPDGMKFRLLYKQFRANLAYADSHRLDGDEAAARAMKRAITDILDQRMGAPEWAAFKSSPAPAPASEPEPARIRRIGLLIRENPAGAMALLEQVRTRFPGAEVETLLFTHDKAFDDVALPGPQRVSMDSFGARAALSSWMPRRYDLVVGPEHLPRFLFDKLVRWNARIAADGTWHFRARRPGELLWLAWRRQVNTWQAFWLARRFMATKPWPVDYHSWNR